VRRWRVGVAIAATLVLVVAQAGSAAADPGDEQRLQQLAREKQELERAVQVSRQNAERYRQEAGRFQAAVDSANARIAVLAEEQANAQNEADALKIDIEIAEEQLALVGFQMSETQALIGSLKAQAAEQNKQLVSRERLYAIHLRTTYLQAQVSPLEMLLSATSLADFVRRVQSMILITRQDQQLAGDIRSLKTSTSQKLEDVGLKQGEIAGLQKQIDGQRTSLAKKKVDYERVAAEMKAGIASQGGLRANAESSKLGAIGAVQQANNETAALNRRLEQTEAAYAQLAAQLASRSGLAVFTGKMVVWPVTGPITSGFGARWGGFHNGIDIAAPMYTPIRAGAAGQVVTVGKPYLAYGDTATVVIIAHGSNFSTLYGHMDDQPGHVPTVRPGQFVTAGTIVGYVGMTGFTTGPHLHFMTIVDGRAVNPMPYMP
jgi:murein DD-endopeptidase MepM/ murein hydrolase activator NlpD